MAERVEGDEDEEEIEVEGGGGGPLEHYSGGDALGSDASGDLRSPSPSHNLQSFLDSLTL